MNKHLRAVLAASVAMAALAVAAIGGRGLSSGKWMVTPVLSGSMRPGFAVGGIVLSEHVPADQLHVRDVIVFKEPGRPGTQVVHRIVKLDSKAGVPSIGTQGDANNVADAWTLTLRDRYAYRVRYSLPLLGYAAVHVRRSTALFGAGLLLLIGCVGAMRSQRASKGQSQQVAESGVETARAGVPRSAPALVADPVLVGKVEDVQQALAAVAGE